MNLYEGMFIFANSVDGDAVDSAVTKVRGEIESIGGKVISNTRLGRRSFARPMNKVEGGQYVVINFELEGRQMDPLKARLKLNEDVFRVQFVKPLPVEEAEPVEQTATPADS